MLPTLTVFTPTYNRAYTLHKCYESLKKQSNRDFMWLIIDDGSTDNTREIVQQWILEDKIQIRYQFQQNRGMHGAHNTAYELMKTELNVCIDSDDYMPNDAVEKIITFWNKHKTANLAGIVGLDAYTDGNIIGTDFPPNIKQSTLFDLYRKHGVTGDKKIVYRTDISKQYPYPIFEGEKYVGLAYKYNKIDLEYKLALMNEVVCIVEYLEDGSSKNMLRQYKRNPKGFSFYRIENMKLPNTSWSFKFKESIHYVASSMLAKNKRFLKETPYKLLSLLAIPLGCLLYVYILYNTKGVN